MKKMICRFIAVLLAVVSLQASAATTALQDYVSACRTQVGFTENIPDMDCRNAMIFDPGNDPANPANSIDAINDAVGFYKVNRDVDLVFACRWMRRDVGDPTDTKVGSPRSVEMLLHNRTTGATCFFDAKFVSQSAQRTQTVVSPTGPNASAFWEDPVTVNSHGACVNCHAAGVYIASRLIAPYLGQFGLLNDKHDLLFNRYHVVVDAGGAFSNWQQIAQSATVTTGCSSACHAIASNSTIAANVHFPNNGFVGPSGGPLARPIKFVIQDVLSHGLMPDSTHKLDNNYRWMNVDIPDDANTTGDVEVFYDLKENFVGFTPTLNSALTCETEPAYMEARVVVGSNTAPSTNHRDTAYTNDPYLSGILPDKLERFDQTGLICRNASQPSGMCSNYVVRFNCLKDQLSVYNAGTGRVLTIANPDANQIRWAKGQPLTPAWYGSQTWHIEGLNDGSTNYNYVRFRNDWLGVRLNADGDSSLASVAGLRDWWLSEQWVMEPVLGSTSVRFRNIWKGTYLTMVDGSDYSAVSTQPLHTDSSGKPDWNTQLWYLQ